MTATLIGAGLGAIAGYLFVTDRGPRLWQQIDQALDEVEREFDDTRDTLHAVLDTASEGRTRLGERRVEQEHSPRTPSASERAV